MCNNKAVATVTTGGRVLGQVTQPQQQQQQAQAQGAGPQPAGAPGAQGAGQQQLLEAARHLQDQVNQLLTHMINTTEALANEAAAGYEDDEDEDEDEEDEAEEKITDSPVKKYKPS